MVRQDYLQMVRLIISRTALYKFIKEDKMKQLIIATRAKQTWQCGKLEHIQARLQEAHPRFGS